jgi:hypothetical protein
MSEQDWEAPPPGWSPPPWWRDVGAWIPIVFALAFVGAGIAHFIWPDVVTIGPSRPSHE